MERVARIELANTPWQGVRLPLHHTRMKLFSDQLNATTINIFMIEQTKILRNLTESEILELKNDLNSIDHLWEDHHQPTALAYGKTIYLKEGNCTPTPILKSDILEYVLNTHKIIETIVKPYYIGRVYWHKLMPGDIISAHDDLELDFIRHKILEHRYQIYLECPDESILIDSNVVKDVKKFENTVVDFALTKTHYYNNASLTPWYFLVFDALNKPLYHCK